MGQSPVCSRCRTVKNAKGLCPFGCEKFAAPHQRQVSTQKRARKRAEEATAPVGVRYEKVMAPTRGRW